ncbi:MAG TPA: cytochrome c [Methylomirabilota bacterium]|jgi:mono/diheme cytochrome c family protein
MKACLRSLTVVAAAAALIAGAGTMAAWAQGEWKAPADQKGVKNPMAGNKAAVAEGKKLAETNCVTCHGPEGKGNGPAAAALPPPKPADWTSAKVAAETDGEIFWKISNGRGSMPPWKHLPDNQRWQLVTYIRSLQKK